jgi:hypothetical protein
MEIIKKNININLVKALENYVSVIVIETIWKTIFFAFIIKFFFGFFFYLLAHEHNFILIMEYV